MILTTISHYHEIAQELSVMTESLWFEEQHEPDTNLSMRLSLLRLEMDRLAKEYAHQALKLELKESLMSPSPAKRLNQHQGM